MLYAAPAGEDVFVWCGTARKSVLLQVVKVTDATFVAN